MQFIAERPNICLGICCVVEPLTHIDPMNTQTQKLVPNNETLFYGIGFYHRFCCFTHWPNITICPIYGSHIHIRDYFSLAKFIFVLYRLRLGTLKWCSSRIPFGTSRRNAFDWIKRGLKCEWGWGETNTHLISGEDIAQTTKHDSRLSLVIESLIPTCVYKNRI